MNRIVHNERGMALAVAIFMLVIVGALVAGALFVGTQDQRSAENTRRLQQAFGIAEQGAFAQVRNWSSGWATLATYPITPATAYPTAGTTASIATTSIAGLGSYSGTVYHVGKSQFLFDITGGDTLSQAGGVAGGGARQRIGLIVRSVTTQVPIKGAVTTRTGTAGDFRGGYKVSGGDSIPHGWAGCSAPGPSIPGFVSQDTVHWTGEAASSITGSPPWVQDTTLKAATMDTVGNTGMTYAQLAAMANITLPGGLYAPAPVSAGGICTTATTTNWGDTLQANPCGSYFPIVHITGDLHAHSGYGQGILLVDGNAVLLNFSWFGMVIIQGALAPNADSTHFFKVTGGLQIKNANGATQDVWDINAKYSSCALSKVFAQIALAVSPLRSRSWAELY